MAEARKLATLADLERLADNVVGELLDGELYVSPRPGGPHSQAETGISAGLFGPFHRRPGGPHGPGGWWILVEPELHLGADVIVPDLAGWRRERMPEGPVAAAFEVAPDWVCEVLSPHTMRHDRIRKMMKYASYAVKHAWLVDPMAQTLEVYRLQEAVGEPSGLWVRVGAYEGYTTVRAEPFEAVELDIGRWWQEEAP